MIVGCCTCRDAFSENNFIRCSSEKWMRLNTIKGRKTKERKKEQINKAEIWKKNRRKYEEENREIR